MRTDGAALSPANPSAANEVRPLWSVMIPTYNPTPHLRDAIVSAQASLSRCGASAQLELIDDASSDGTAEVVATTWVVLLCSAFFGTYLWGLDQLFSRVVAWAFRALGAA